MTDERRKALQDAARSECYLCREEELSELDEVTGRYYHRDEAGYFYNSGFCRANNIRFMTETRE